MNFDALYTRLKENMPELSLRRFEPMKNHCSFRIGGPAEIFAEPAGEAELCRLLCLLREANIEPFIIGNGTNLLISDDGIRGVVVKIGPKMSEIRVEGSSIYAMAGASLAQIASAARDAGLSGMEFAHGIPGFLGGAAVMNAGAYGGEMAHIVAKIRYIGKDGEIHESADNDFGYRHSRFSESGDIIIGAELSLTPGKTEEIADRMLELWKKRSASQPLEKASAGSTFKRPQGGYAAAMIDGAGLKGCAFGAAKVSEKHAGFVINEGGASFDDVIELIEHIKKEVLRVYGTELETEVKIIR